jgi:hypothetical protein
MNKSDELNTKTDRLGITFHRSFPLKRSAVKEVIKLIVTGINIGEQEKYLSRKDIRENSQLGTIYVEAMPRWAKGSGLIDNEKHPTVFGKCVSRFDENLDQQTTQWLMHYYLSAPDGPGPAFWHELVKTRFRSGDEFSTSDIENQISCFVQTTEGKQLAARSVESTARAFLETYTRQDGLAQLGLLEECREKRYRVPEPDTPPVWVVALAIQDLWQARYRNQVSINLNDLYGENGLTNIFLIGRGRLNSMLEQLQEERIVDLFRVAPPYQVLLLLHDPEPILKRLYGYE